MAHVNKSRRSWQPVYEPHARRKEENKTFYNSTAWRKARAQQLMHQPMCVNCEAEGVSTVGRVVDHVTPINQGGAELDPNNLQTLCDACHNVKSGKEGSFNRKSNKKGVWGAKKHT